METIKKFKHKFEGFFIEGGKKSPFSMELTCSTSLDENLFENESICFTPKTLKEFKEMIAIEMSSLFQGKGTDYLGNFTVILDVHHISTKDPMKAKNINILNLGDKCILLKKYEDGKPHDNVIVCLGEVTEEKKITGKWNIFALNGDFEMSLIN